MKKTALITVSPGKTVRLRDIDPDATGQYEHKEQIVERVNVLRKRLSTLQEALYAEDKRSLLLIFQAMDTGGKDGAVKHLLTGIDPAGIEHTSFKAPSATELSHDFLWRCHNAVPSRGRIGSWNRSHYEDVLIVRVHKMIERKTWLNRYEDINAFEKMLTNNGVKIVKFYLHISKDEQEKRLQSRLDDPTKHWKFNLGDLQERRLWNDYQEAYEDVLNACSTEHAPWHIVPANHKWARNIAVAECVVAALEEMKPRYPKPSFDPKSIKIDD